MDDALDIGCCGKSAKTEHNSKRETKKRRWHCVFSNFKLLFSSEETRCGVEAKKCHSKARCTIKNGEEKCECVIGYIALDNPDICEGNFNNVATLSCYFRSQT